MAATADASSISLTITEEVSTDETPAELAADISETDSEDASEKGLKKAWLKFLPAERVIELVLKFDEHASVDVRREIWPTDLKTTVFNAAVAAIIESSSKGKAIDLASLGVNPPQPMPNDRNEKEETSEAAAARDASPSTDVEDTPPVSKPSEVPLTSQMPIPPLSTASTSTSASMSTAPPATAMTPYGSSPSFSYPYPYPYPLHQAYPYVYSVPATSGPTTYSPTLPSSPNGKARSQDKPDDDDLPSYEEMLVQALIEHNNPTGTAPKQLFQWMAAHYPLQANFRPSASQALQKAFKRGRFEKNKDGKYRLNPAWEGGSTSKRTTRRPQSYAKAVTNPSPSSHPPANLSYPPYLWQSAQKQPMRNSLSTHQEAAKTVAAAASLPEGGIPDAESHRDAWEAAQSILQALNFGTALDSTSNSSKQPGGTTSPKPIPVPIDPELLENTGSMLTLPSQSTSTDADQSAPVSLPVVPSVSTHILQLPTVSVERTALQRSLALLAAQLADLATEDDSDPTSAPASSSLLASSEWPTLAEAVSLTASLPDTAAG